MDLSLTQSQEMLKAAARELVEREYPKEALVRLDAAETGDRRDLWKKTTDAGWLGILVPGEFGGEGGSLTDAAVLFQELGRGPVPGPHFSTAVLGTLAIMEGASTKQKLEILPDVPTGQRVLSLAVTEAEYGWGRQFTKTTALLRDGGYIINGVKLFVQDAQDATHLICTAALENGAVGLFLVDASLPGVEVRPLSGFMTDSFEVKLDDVNLPPTTLLGDGSEDGWEALQRAMLKAIPVLSAYQVGGCEKVFEMTLDYSNTRVQFGLPIGRFQRVQDHVIHIVNELDAARWTTYEALWKLDAGKPGGAAAVHVSKSVASEAYYQVCNAAHEVHAGLGIMREYGLTLHTRMSRTLYHYLGDPNFHKRRLAEALSL